MPASNREIAMSADPQPGQPGQPDPAARPAGGPSSPASWTSHGIEAAGLSLHYLDYGTQGKTPMLCLHGGAAHAHWFDFVVGGFTDRYHVRSLDLRGHGDSAWSDLSGYNYRRYADDVAEVVERLDLRDFVLVGHSMGGMVSLVYAATYPGRVARLVVVDSTLHMNEERVAEMRSVGARQGSTYASLDELVRRFRLRPPGSAPAPHILAHVAVQGARQTADGTWALKFDRNIMASRVSYNGLPHWSNITIPALLVKGGLSARITPEIVAEVRERAPQTELVEVPGAEHHVTLDNPSGFVAAVRSFLARS